MTRPPLPAPGPANGAGGLTADQIAELSSAELSAGRLPLRAQWRLAEQRERRERGEPGSFTSNLTTDEFAAIRSVGFAPVGQVMGSVVINVGWLYASCGYYAGGGYGFGMSPVVSVKASQQIMNQARFTAIDRLRQECAGLGGDGVVGVCLTAGYLRGHRVGVRGDGTAVRADGDVRPKKPFTSDLSGQDFAKLLRAGWMPVGFVQGVGITLRHKDWTQSMQQRSFLNQELVGPTALVSQARKAARKTLRNDAAQQGGHSVVLRDMYLNMYETRCRSNTEGEDSWPRRTSGGQPSCRSAPATPTSQNSHSPCSALTRRRATRSEASRPATTETEESR